VKAEVAATKRQADDGKRSDHLFCHRKLKQLDLHGTLTRQMPVAVFLPWIDPRYNLKITAKRQAKEELLGGLFSVISELFFMWNCLLERKRKE
jgi:hypothetical protein